MFGRKYYYNPDSLMIEEVKYSPRQKKLRFFGIAAIVFTAAFVLRVVFDQTAQSPKEKLYITQNQELREKFQQMEMELLGQDVELATLRNRDDKLYRAFVGLDPLSPTVREAGTGGTFRYQSLYTISEPSEIVNTFMLVDKLSSKAQVQENSFETVYKEARDKERLIASKPSIQPISPADPYWLTSSFGYRIDPFNKRLTSHHGIDLAGPYGLNIYATGDGVVIHTEVSRSGYGREVVISHGFGYTTRYAHLQEINVKVGEKVKRGQLVGLLGSSGRSTGPHLHYEVRLNNKPLNPFNFFYEELSPLEYDKITANASK